MPISDLDDEEQVGRARPPKQHQFKPGQSGNPKGRPKGALGIRKILEEELGTRLSITVDGKHQKVSALQLVVKRMLEKALKGEQRAIEQLITLNISMFGLGDDTASQAAKLTPGEAAFLDALANRLPSGDAEAGHQSDVDLLHDKEDGDDAD